MEHPIASQREVALDANGRIDEDVACIQCGYNQRGLSPEGVCPECATPVGRSVKGDYLRFASPQWVETLAAGMNWIVASIVIVLLGSCLVGAASRSAGGAELGQLVVMALGIVRVIGFWMVTTPDPGRGEDQGQVSARQVARTTVILTYLIGWLNLGSGYWPGWVTLGLGLLAAVGSMVEMIAILVYGRRLALRIPDWKLADSCRQVMWGWIGLYSIVAILVVVAMAGGPSLVRGAGGRMSGLAILGCATAAAAMILAIMMLVLVLRFRRQLAASALHARATWAAAAPLPTGSPPP
ncbi:MAG: hypothetical protein HRF43_13130 [Phycisphaerae bacterium]|jgi:hypothetical protein